MGVLTFAGAVEEVRRELGNRGGFSGDQIKRLLCASLIHVASPAVFKHPELFITESVTVVAGVNEVAVGVVGIGTRTLVFVEGVRNYTEDYHLIHKDKRWMRERRQTTEGRPDYYCHTSIGPLHVAELWPTPTAQYGGNVLHVEGYYTPEVTGTAVIDTATFPISREWDEVVVKGAVWRGWNWLGRPDMADAARADYAGLINDKRERLDFEQEADPIGLDVILGPSYQRFTK